MAKPLLPDERWAMIEPLLPPEPPKPKGGRPLMAKRAALTGILFVQRSGIPWEMLPQKMGCGSGMTCWRRLRDWHEAGVWHRIHQVLLDRLGEADQVDWSRASLDSASRYSSGVLILGLCPHLLELPSAGALLGALGREGGAVIESQSQVWKEAK